MMMIDIPQRTIQAEATKGRTAYLVEGVEGSFFQKVKVELLQVRRVAKNEILELKTRDSKAYFLSTDELALWQLDLLRRNKSRQYGTLIKDRFLHSSYIPFIGYIATCYEFVYGYTSILDVSSLLSEAGEYDIHIKTYNNMVANPDRHYPFIKACFEKGLLFLSSLIHYNFSQKIHGVVLAEIDHACNELLLPTLPCYQNAKEKNQYIVDDQNYEPLHLVYGANFCSFPEVSKKQRALAEIMSVKTFKQRVKQFHSEAKELSKAMNEESTKVQLPSIS